MDVLEPKIKELDICPSLLKIPIIEEKLDTSYKESVFKITWTSKDGEETDITKLGDSHLFNLSRWLVRKGLPRTTKIIAGEGIRRTTGGYPPDFEEVIKEYKNNPETWRLKIYL